MERKLDLRGKTWNTTEVVSIQIPVPNTAAVQQSRPTAEFSSLDGSRGSTQVSSLIDTLWHHKMTKCHRNRYS